MFLFSNHWNSCKCPVKTLNKRVFIMLNTGWLFSLVYGSFRIIKKKTVETSMYLYCSLTHIVYIWTIWLWGPLKFIHIFKPSNSSSTWHPRAVTVFYELKTLKLITRVNSSSGLKESKYRSFLNEITMFHEERFLLYNQWRLF